MSTAPSSARKIAGVSVRAIITSTLLLLVFRRVDTGSFWQMVRTAQWRFVLGVWLLAAMFFWVQSVAMKLILRRQNCEVSVNTIFGASCITALYSLVLPGILSTGVKWYILKRSTGKGSSVLSAMLYNQVALTVVMVVVGLAGLIFVNPTRMSSPDEERSWLLPLTSGIVLIAVLLSSVLMATERAGGAAIRQLTAVLKPLPSAVQHKIKAVVSQLAVFQTAGWRFHGVIALINIADTVLIGLLIYLFAALAASVVVPIGVLIWLCAIVFVLGKVPISVANLGVREVTLIGLLAGYGVTESSALLMSMILFSSLVFLAAIGAAYRFFWSVRKR